MNHKVFKISDVEIIGHTTILEQDIDTVVQKYLQKKILWIFPRNNILLTQTHRIQKNIENNFPKIYSAQTSLKNKIITIHIEERSAHSLWCKHDMQVSVEDVNTIHGLDIDQNLDKNINFDEECYFADQKGFIYTRAPFFSEGVFEKIYTTSDRLVIGQQVDDKEDFERLFLFTQSLLDNYNIQVNRIFVESGNSVRMYIDSLIDQSFENEPYIHYNYKDSYELLGRNIGLMVNHELFQNEFTQQPQRLEYIDVRIPDQIRYKFTPYENNTENNSVSE